MEKVRIVYTVRKNEGEEFRLSLKEYKERQYLDLRLWFQPSQGGDYRPTKKGLTLAVEHVAELKKGLERVLRVISEGSLHRPSNSLEYNKLEKVKNPNYD